MWNSSVNQLLFFDRPETVILKEMPPAQCLQNSMEFLKRRKMQVSRSTSVLKNANQALRLLSSQGSLFSRSWLYIISCAVAPSWKSLKLLLQAPSLYGSLAMGFWNLLMILLAFEDFVPYMFFWQMYLKLDCHRMLTVSIVASLVCLIMNTMKLWILNKRI